MPYVASTGRLLDVAQAISDDERVAGVLGEQLVGFDVQRVRKGIPHDLVDADYVAGRVVSAVACCRD